MSKNVKIETEKPLKSILKKTSPIENPWDPKDYENILGGMKIKREFIEIQKHHGSFIYDKEPEQCFVNHAPHSGSAFGPYRFSTEHGTGCCISEFHFLFIIYSFLDFVVVCPPFPIFFPCFNHFNLIFMLSILC